MKDDRETDWTTIIVWVLVAIGLILFLSSGDGFKCSVRIDSKPSDASRTITKEKP